MSENDILMHYGIIGMKWGVRRTPEQLGHKRAEKARGKLQKYKDQKIKKVDKMYAKAIRETEKALEYDPGNKKLLEQLDGLNKLKAKDIEKIDSMTYTDVVQEQKETAQRRKETVGKVVSTTAKTVGATTLWAAKMGLVGVRVYGMFKAAQIAGEFAARGIEWLGSPEGQEFINKGANVVNTFMNFGDKAAKLANADLGDYLDPTYLADQATTVGKQYVVSTYGADIKRMGDTVNSLTNTVDNASRELERVEKQLASRRR